jgi:hypothetical protein
MTIKVKGIPPHKGAHFSIRNPKHANHDRFTLLRKKANEAMGKMPYSSGPIGVTIRYQRQLGSRPSADYVSGIFDTLGGSHGMQFHWMPIVYLDDNQIRTVNYHETDGAFDYYEIDIEFLQTN